MDGCRSCNYLLKKANIDISSINTNNPIVEKKTQNSDNEPINLSDLKIGMQLEGVVVSCSGFAAFLDLNVYRTTAKAGNSKVNAILYHSDMKDDVVLSTRKWGLGSDKDRTVIEKGTRLTVYVKELLKNQGYTVYKTYILIN